MSSTATPERQGILSFFQNVGNNKPSTTKKKPNDDNKESKTLDNTEDINEHSDSLIVLEEDADTLVGRSDMVLEEEVAEQGDVETKDVTIIPSDEPDVNALKEKDDQESFPSMANKELVKDENAQDSVLIEPTVADDNEVKEEKDPMAKTPEVTVSKKEQLAIKREEARKEKEKRKKAIRLEKELKKKERDERVRKEKEAKLKQREEEKRRREEERLKAKQQREEEKLRAKKVKENEKIRKEKEKKMKEEAKERAQSRIGNFFRKVGDSSRQSKETSDFERDFLPFYARDGVKLSNLFRLSKFDLSDKKAEVDSFLKQSTEDDNLLEWLSTRYQQRGYPVKYTAVSLLQQMTSKDKTDDELQSILSKIPHKYIKFYENVRPPFIGTYSKICVLPTENPFETEGTGFDYDYDSDLEWVNEEDEEGAGIDNLESGEEDDEEDDEDDPSEGEFDGFLDTDENGNPANGKKKFIGPLIPTVLLRGSAMDEDDKRYFHMVSVDVLLEKQELPIDCSRTLISSQKDMNTGKRSVDKVAGFSTEVTHSEKSASSSPEKKQKALIVDPKDLLKLFDEVQDSTFSLGTVTEIAQKSLPYYNKQTIKNTVKEYATRSSGKGDTARKWEIKNMKYWEELRNITQ
ncbi:hypothetical protein KAFR_0C03120 [Kazachstania africana CBS 2517]|uniref:Uncharacterized protein n=1 Tax=Kazachstania africana (strain ATCC 22294 / BCRC 22015 / CBS 2517 / CECT 1963 / NBRC 1671 / NRRL Y-8276) TaxID=1071382 RepID=H2ASF4_KAZAF|nr:hypothetical protein KAFR_0C03120 [Kazachstania africana CBS 2517]CCF57304.1 hypothetical protein KAFR_0C03120 [Kazachstania africana CBS 2517]